MRFCKQARILRMCLLQLQPAVKLLTQRRTFSTTRICHNGYYILLPAVPPDNAENNPLLQTEGLPQYAAISESQVLSGLGKITIDYESAFYRMEEDIQKSREQRTFSSVFDPLDKLNHSLVHAFSTAATLNAGRKSAQIEEALLQSEQAVARCRSLPNSSQTVLRAVKEISKEEGDLTQAQERVLSKYLLESRLNGANLNSKDQRTYQSIVTTLRDKQEDFRGRLVASSGKFFSSILNPASMDEAPESVLALFQRDPSEGGSRSVSLKTPVYEAFMQYCRDSKQRWNAWQAFVGRAGFRDPDLNNSLVIEDIRQMRSKEAKMFGYENYASLSMETKMAGSVENVTSAVSQMTLLSKIKCQKEMEFLQKFANQSGCTTDLQLWDVAYWRRRQREATYRIQDAEVRAYFPFPVVLEELFRLCKHLFNITITEDTKNAKNSKNTKNTKNTKNSKNTEEFVPVWHEDVKFYRITEESGEEVGGFYLDPFARPGQKEGGAKLVLGQNRSEAVGSSPLSALIFNFLPPTSSSPSLLTFDDVNVLFQKFGTSLQHLLTRMRHSDVSGLNNVEWDALHISGGVLRMFLQNRNVLKRMTKHFQNGNEIPDDLAERLLQSGRHLSSLDLLAEMYFGVLDLTLYTKTDFWQDVMKDVWRDFMPFALEKADAHPCGFAHIFIGPYAAGYYSFLWSEMVAADVYSAFSEAGFTNEKEIRQTGKLFRDTFLSLGGGCHSAEVFRKFRGRDPSPQALLRLHEIV